MSTRPMEELTPDEQEKKATIGKVRAAVGHYAEQEEQLACLIMSSIDLAMDMGMRPVDFIKVVVSAVMHSMIRSVENMKVNVIGAADLKEAAVKLAELEKSEASTKH